MNRHTRNQQLYKMFILGLSLNSLNNEKYILMIQVSPRTILASFTVVLKYMNTIKPTTTTRSIMVRMEDTTIVLLEKLIPRVLTSTMMQNSRYSSKNILKKKLYLKSLLRLDNLDRKYVRHLLFC